MIYTAILSLSPCYTHSLHSLTYKQTYTYTQVRLEYSVNIFKLFDFLHFSARATADVWFHQVRFKGFEPKTNICYFGDRHTTCVTRWRHTICITRQRHTTCVTRQRHTAHRRDVPSQLLRDRDRPKKCSGNPQLWQWVTQPAWRRDQPASCLQEHDRQILSMRDKSLATQLLRECGHRVSHSCSLYVFTSMLLILFQCLDSLY